MLDFDTLDLEYSSLTPLGPGAMSCFQIVLAMHEMDEFYDIAVAME